MTDSITKLIDEIGLGYMPATAYDTAWAARLGEIDSVLSNRALGWLTTHQLPDGSWGAPAPMYYHDRVVCTLAAMIALTYRGHRDYDRVQVERGQMALDRILSGATGGLQADPNGATIGFEMIAPTLAAEAEKLGLIKNQGNRRRRASSPTTTPCRTRPRCSAGAIAPGRSRRCRRAASRSTISRRSCASRPTSRPRKRRGGALPTSLPEALRRRALLEFALRSRS